VDAKDTTRLGRSDILALEQELALRRARSGQGAPQDAAISPRMTRDEAVARIHHSG